MFLLKKIQDFRKLFHMLKATVGQRQRSLHVTFFVTKCVDMYHINAFCINFLDAKCVDIANAFCNKKNQNVPIVTLVQNALYQCV